MAREQEVASLFITLRANSERLGGDLRGVQAKVAASGKAIGRALSTAITAGITLGIGYAIKTAMNFESELLKVAEAADISPEGLAALGNELKVMSRTIPVSAEGLAKLAASAAGMGVAANDLTKFVALSAKMSVAFGIPAEEAGDSMLKLSKALDIPLEGMTAFGDAIDVLGDKTGASASGIIDAMLKVGSTGKIFGLTAEETLALTAAMIALGIQPRKAGTAINELLTTLQNFDQQSGNFKGAVFELGFRPEEFKAMMATTPNEGLMTILDRLSELQGANLSSKLEDMFGGAAPAIGTLVTGLDTYKSSLALVNNEQAIAGSMQEAFATRSETTASKFQLLKNAFTEVANELGTALLPTMTAVAESLISIVTPISDLITKFPELSQGVIITALSFGGLSKLLSIVSGGSLSLTHILGTILVGSFNAVMLGIRALGVAMMANPIGFLVGALAIAAVLIITNWDTVKTFFEGFWAKIEPAWGKFAESIKTAFGSAKDVFNNVIDSIMSKVTAFMDHVEKLKRKVMGLFRMKGPGGGGSGSSGGGSTGGSTGGGMAGFAHGGSFTVGGHGPTDTSLVSFMATPGERVTIETPGQQRVSAQKMDGEGGSIVQNFNISTGVQETVRAELLSLLPGLKMSVQDSLSRSIVRNSRFSSKIRYNV